MKSLHVFPLIIAATFALDFDSFQRHNGRIEGRLTRGSDAIEGEFAYHARLSLGRDIIQRRQCSGSLIGYEWVLTSANCLRQAEFAIVSLGCTDRSKCEYERTIKKGKFIICDDVVAGKNIALIKIPRVDLKKNIRIVELPPISQNTLSTYENEYAHATGWGKLSDASERLPNLLQWSRFQIIANADCAKKLHNVTDSILCIATPGGRSPCHGDDGGPLVLENGQIQVGVLLMHEDDCQSEYPVAYARLTSCVIWIYIKTGIRY